MPKIVDILYVVHYSCMHNLTRTIEYIVQLIKCRMVLRNLSSYATNNVLFLLGTVSR